MPKAKTRPNNNFKTAYNKIAAVLLHRGFFARCFVFAVKALLGFLRFGFFGFFLFSDFSESGKNRLKEALVPGSVQRDLIRLGELPDPYWATNEKKVQWVEDKNWEFRKTFTIDSVQLTSDEALLCFEGLDTYADVFLNGSKILQAENMFLLYEVSVKRLLKKGENNLFIRFY